MEVETSAFRSRYFEFHVAFKADQCGGLMHSSIVWHFFKLALGCVFYLILSIKKSLKWARFYFEIVIDKGQFEGEEDPIFRIHNRFTKDDRAVWEHDQGCFSFVHLLESDWYCKGHSPRTWKIVKLCGWIQCRPIKVRDFRELPNLSHL